MTEIISTKKYYCEHGTYKYQCKECGGSSICEHGRQRSTCKECGGSSICEHGRRRSTCKECGGSSICEHRRERNQCKECGGSKICEHGRIRSTCKECGGTSVCEHGRQRPQCTDCKGSQCCINCIAINSEYVNIGYKRYDKYCFECFKHLFPLDERVKNHREKVKELRVRNAINIRFDGFQHDKSLETGGCDCSSRRRIDHRKLINGTMLAIETDEFKHGSYDPADEKNRYDDLYCHHSGNWIFIRFNPDGGKGMDIDDMTDVLLETIQTHIDRINNFENSELVEIHYLYY